VLTALAGAAAIGFVPLVKAQLVALNQTSGGQLKRLLDSVQPWAGQGEGKASPLGLPGITQWAVPLLGALRSAAGGAATVLAIAVLALLCLLFGKDAETLALGWLEPRRRSRAEARLRQMREGVSRYLAGALTMSALGAAVTTLLLLLFHVRYFALVGMVMLGLGLIPTIGPLIGEVLVGLTTLEAQGLRRAILVVMILVAYEALAGNLLAPLVQGKALRMNPLLTTLVLLAGTQLGGIAGAILALPIAAAAQVQVQELKEVRASRWSTPPDHA
jgi:predicted PurR-regulated permease PerM